MTEQEIFEIFSQIKDPDQAEKFLKDILTDKELEEVKHRWALVKGLYEGKSQRTVRDEIGVSIATVTRGSQILKKGHGGILEMLEKDISFSQEQDLDKIRKQIDSIDHKIIDLLAQRSHLMPYVAQMKKNKKLRIIQRERENQSLSEKKKVAKKKGLDADFIELIFTKIFAEAKKLQIPEIVSHSFDDVTKLKKKNSGQILPLTITLNTDTETPISLYKRLTKDRPYSFILESTGKDKKFSRYSFIGTNPQKILKFDDHKYLIKSHNNIEEGEFEDPLTILRREMVSKKLIIAQDLPRFIGGAIGYLGYDCIQYFEKRVRVPSVDDLNVPDAQYCIYDHLTVYDHIERKIILVSMLDLSDSESKLKEKYKNILEQFSERLACLEEKIHLEPISANLKKNELDFDSNMSKTDFIELVKKAKKDIRNGEIFQLILSQRFHINLKTTGFDLYRSLRQVNPSSYLFYLNYPDYAVIGASPETFVQVQDGRVRMKALAGTAERTGDLKIDEKMLENLKEDKKEVAEHMMLVDLARNDVGRVSVNGSVQVENMMHVSKGSYVYHLASDISGQLRSDKDALDVLKACFPRGTLSGAPKVRAMELISKYENVRRKIYGGAVNYLDYSGNLDAAICIRTMLKKGDDIYIQAGAGIVHDSKPEKEYRETIIKANGVLKSVEGVQQYTLKE